jgi:hypothetical protein
MSLRMNLFIRPILYFLGYINVILDVALEDVVMAIPNISALPRN